MFQMESWASGEEWVSLRWRPVAVIEAGAGHALAQAAFFEEVLFQPTKLLVNQVIGLVDETDGNVGNALWGGRVSTNSR